MASNVALESIRRPQIIDAALRSIAESGFQNITLDDVARAAGMSKGGLVYYFPTKDSLIKQAVVEFYNQIFERGRETRDQQSDPLEQVLSFTWIYDFQDPDVRVGYRLLFDFMALASQDDDYRRLFHDWFENWIALLEAPILDGIRAGSFRVKDVAGTARTISAIYQGIATRWYLDRETHSTEWAVKSVRRAVTLLLMTEED